MRVASPFTRVLIPPDRSEKEFLFDIVANKRNGLDVDKWVLVLPSLVYLMTLTTGLITSSAILI